MSELTHLDAAGHARMVDVSAKEVTARTATAVGRVLLSAGCVAALREGTVPKGDALAVARIAGIQGAKLTPTLVCTVGDEGVDIAATVRTNGRTGVEMEALTAVCTAALAVVDMTKAIDKHARITDVTVVAKAGGRSGDWSLDSEGGRS